MTTPITTVRFLAVANHLADMARTEADNSQRAKQFDAERMAAFEHLTDRQIELESTVAALATTRMAHLQMQKRLRQKQPKLNRLYSVLEQATTRFITACSEGDEEALLAGKDYAVAFEEHQALSAELDCMGQRLSELERRTRKLYLKLEELKIQVAQAEEEYGESELTLDGFSQATTAMRQTMVPAQRAALQAAFELFGSKNG